MYCRGGVGIKIGPWETENSAQFWANNKIFVNYQAKFIQAVQIFAGPRQESPTRHLSQSSSEVLVTNGRTQ